jgi:hypothetical protein
LKLSADYLEASHFYNETPLLQNLSGSGSDIVKRLARIFNVNLVWDCDELLEEICTRFDMASKKRSRAASSVALDNCKIMLQKLGRFYDQIERDV